MRERERAVPVEPGDVGLLNVQATKQPHCWLQGGSVIVLVMYIQARVTCIYVYYVDRLLLALQAFSYVYT